MMTLVRSVAVAAMIWSLSPSAMAGGACCKEMAEKGGWCDHCKVGFVSTVQTQSKKLYDALQGVAVSSDKAGGCGCAGCKAGMEKNGSCEKCNTHFANHAMYHSAVAARLAVGKPVSESDPTCAKCKEYVAKNGVAATNEMIGWCDECKAGIVKGRRFETKESFEAAKAAYELVARAAKAAEKCEDCAVAMVTDSKCEHCNVTFKDGAVTKADSR